MHGMAAAGLSAGAQPSVLDGQHSHVFGFPCAYGGAEKNSKEVSSKAFIRKLSIMFSGFVSIHVKLWVKGGGVF